MILGQWFSTVGDFPLQRKFGDVWRQYWILDSNYFFFYDLFVFREREGREKIFPHHQCAVASRTPPTEDLTCNPGMCPDWESNP